MVNFTIINQNIKFMRSIEEIYKDLKTDFPKMSDYELMKLAIQMDRNNIFQRAFAAYENHPSALEAIAIQLGYAPKGHKTLLDSIESLAHNDD